MGDSVPAARSVYIGGKQEGLTKGTAQVVGGEARQPYNNWTARRRMLVNLLHLYEKTRRLGTRTPSSHTHTSAENEII